MRDLHWNCSYNLYCSLWCLRRDLGVSWQGEVTNYEVLDKACIPSMYTLLRQCRLWWLGHVPPKIPAVWLAGHRVQRRRPQLRYKDVYKRDMKALKWTTPIGSIWRITYLLGNKNYHQAPQKWGTRPQRNIWRETQERERVLAVKCASDWRFCLTCQGCNRHCKSRTGLYIHTRRCPYVDSMGATSIVWQDWHMPMMMHYSECHSYIAIELHLFHTPNIF